MQGNTLSAARDAARRKGGIAAAGFTLLELLIVISIILVLLGMAAPRYDYAVKRAKEAKLKTDLRVMREAIESYTLDRQSAPQSLEDLTSPQTQYLRSVPPDPITGLKDWHADFGDVVLSPEQSNSGIVDVHSSAKGNALDGSPYSEW